MKELRDALANEDMLEPGELDSILEEVDTDKVRQAGSGEVVTMHGYLGTTKLVVMG